MEFLKIQNYAGCLDFEAEHDLSPNMRLTSRVTFQREGKSYTTALLQRFADGIIVDEQITEMQISWSDAEAIIGTPVNKQDIRP